MFHSRVDRYNVHDATPFGRDVIGEVAESCPRPGLRLGLYYSQDLDWHEPHGGGYRHGHTNADCMSWTNDWDYPDNDRKDYTQCFEAKIRPQVEEILRSYGELCLIWFATPLTLSAAQGAELYRLVRQHQPGCLVNSRLGNGLGNYRSWGDNQIPDEQMSGGLFETPATLNDMLNVGPDALGRIPAPCQEILRRVGQELRR